jgi:hypothetical protein
MTTTAHDIIAAARTDDVAALRAVAATHNARACMGDPTSMTSPRFITPPPPAR